MKAGSRVGGAESKIMSQERGIVNDKVETAIAFDANGNVIGREAGDERSVMMAFGMNGLPAVITHNHPAYPDGSNTYFSAADMAKIIMFNELKEFRMVTKDESGKAWAYSIGLGKYSKTEMRDRLYAEFGKNSGVVGGFKFLENRIGTKAYYNAKDNGIKLSVALDKAMKQEFDKLGISYSRKEL